MLHTLAATFGFAPLVPLWLLALLGLVAVGLCVLALVYRTKGALFRLAAIATVLLWLSGPQRLHGQRLRKKRPKPLHKIPCRA